ncbi:MmgE/Prp family protein [Caballeronia temeraria]|uniref:MmgE/Prp family protein n=1 Tax=Caballeronia temeraria TaxID=1777137 RepID=A0A158DJ49_9BURK|nr:MmgE/PrpD family protein [Caballeronia temeraria]SAK94604.1 MmgE/Prp family protein [Caballeronia temeraria]
MPQSQLDDSEGVSQAVARYVRDTHWSDLPEVVRHEAVRAFINWVGCAYGGARHEATLGALAGLKELSTSGPCSVLGHSIQIDPTSAALVNGLAASANAWDDTHLSTIAHPTAPTAAALLAQAQVRRVSGQDFLLALVLSNELQARLSCALAVAPAKVDIGFYMTGLTGAPGVAAGVAKLMGLSTQQIAYAIGIGATQGAGFRATHGTMCGGFVPANAGRNGLLAAHFAAIGFTCHEDTLGGANGFLQVFGHPANPAALTEKLGEHFECMNVAAKPFPAGCLIHPAIEVCLQLRTTSDVSSRDVERVELQVSPLGLGLTGKSKPRHAYDAQVSVYHWAAAVMHHGRAGLYEASDSCVQDPSVIAMRNRIFVQVAEDLSADAARGLLILRNGQQIEASIDACLGSAQRPMSDEQIEAKTLSQVEPLLGSARAQELVDLCWNLPAVQDVGNAAPGFWR